jgi:hypothetical protein
LRFVDTTVLLYAVSAAPRERANNARALAILDDDDLALSVQVLQEQGSESRIPSAEVGPARVMAGPTRRRLLLASLSLSQSKGVTWN